MAQVSYPEPLLTLEELIGRNASLLRRLEAERATTAKLKETVSNLRAHLSVGVNARATAAEVERLTARVKELEARPVAVAPIVPPTDESATLRRLRANNNRLAQQNQRLLADALRQQVPLVGDVIASAERTAAGKIANAENALMQSQESRRLLTGKVNAAFFVLDLLGYRDAVRALIAAQAAATTPEERQAAMDAARVAVGLPPYGPKPSNSN